MVSHVLSHVVWWKKNSMIFHERKLPSRCLYRGGKCITHYTCSYGNDLDIYPATTCDCGRKFNSLRGSRIHKVRWCEQCNSSTGEFNRMMGLWIRIIPIVFTNPLLKVSVLETFLASQEFRDPRVIRWLSGQTLTRSFLFTHHPSWGSHWSANNIFQFNYVWRLSRVLLCCNA